MKGYLTQATIIGRTNKYTCLKLKKCLTALSARSIVAIAIYGVDGRDFGVFLLGHESP